MLMERIHYVYVLCFDFKLIVCNLLLGDAGGKIRANGYKERRVIFFLYFNLIKIFFFEFQNFFFIILKLYSF